MNYFTELGEWDHWHTWDLEQVLKGRRLDVAKFELYSSHFHSEDQPDVIRKLIPVSHPLLCHPGIIPADQGETAPTDHRDRLGRGHRLEMVWPPLLAVL